MKAQTPRNTNSRTTNSSKAFFTSKKEGTFFGRKSISRSPFFSDSPTIQKQEDHSSDCYENPLGRHLPEVGTAHAMPRMGLIPCSLTLAAVKASPNWCKDPFQNHAGEVCYREIPPFSLFGCPPAKQFCFTEDGCCHDSPDTHSPISSFSSGSESTCLPSPHCLQVHIISDVL